MNQPSAADTIVTLQTLLDAQGEQRPGLESIAHRRTKQEYDEAVAKVAEETRKVGTDVFVTVQDAKASVIQSSIAERSKRGRRLSGAGFEAKFGEGLKGGDWWGWVRSVLDHVGKKHEIKRPNDDKVGSIADTCKIAVLADWGTNLYGAPASAASILDTGGFEMLLHLGDIYYSGTASETKARFLDVWPTSAGKVSRALNGNHEMYSGGEAYFDHILPHFDQPSSYFAVQNDHWLLIGLDTAYEDHDLDGPQTAWLNAVVRHAGVRKIVLFSHHQPFSRLDKQGPKLQAALARLFQEQRITAWYWGHEHDCIIYDKHPQTGLLGRCIGHGGIPSPRKSVVIDAPAAAQLHGIQWKRLDADQNAPACQILDGPNPLVKGEEQKFGPHGYLTLAFEGPQLVERIHLPDGREIFAGVVH